MTYEKGDTNESTQTIWRGGLEEPTSHINNN